MLAGTAPAVIAGKIISDRPPLFAGVGDPVARGFLKSFAVPEGRMTGSNDMLPGVTERRLASAARRCARRRCRIPASCAARRPPRKKLQPANAAVARP